MRRNYDSQFSEQQCREWGPTAQNARWLIFGVSPSIRKKLTISP